MYKNILVISCCLLLAAKTEAADTFAALIHLEASIQAESDIIPHINRYIEAEQERIDRLKGLVKEFSSHHQQLSSGNAERHLSNPVNAFLLTYKMHKLATRSEELIDETANANIHAYLNESKAVRLQFPTKEDLENTVLGLIRLQDTYNLTTAQLADSDLRLRRAEDEAPLLSGDDCYKIGQILFLKNDFYHPILWLQKALEKYDLVGGEKNESIRDNLSSTLNYLNYALYRQGNLERAIAIATRWTEMIPGVEPGTTNLEHYHEELEESNLTFNPNNLPPLKLQPAFIGYTTQRKSAKAYRRLCRGDRRPEHIKLDSQLKCKYRMMLYSYYPAREEELNLEPRLVFYHQVLTDSEIQRIKELAQPKLHRSIVLDEHKQSGIISENRVSKSAWIRDLEDEVAARVSTRISRITGLTLESAEPLQVLNYGIGGYYETHYDFFDGASKNERLFINGDRIATFILYLTDVEKGGATVFPVLEAVVWPEKGGAAFWYNLHPNGSGDERTMHGACPVLTGYKWVCNKWFAQKGNYRTSAALKN